MSFTNLWPRSGRSGTRQSSGSLATSATRPLRARGRGLRSRLQLEALEDRFAPANLLHSLFPDATGPQQGAEFGQAVATDTNFHVVGASFSDVGSFADSGQAFVYNATTGALVLR